MGSLVKGVTKAKEDIPEFSSNILNCRRKRCTSVKMIKKVPVDPRINRFKRNEKSGSSPNSVPINAA